MSKKSHDISHTNKGGVGNTKKEATPQNNERVSKYLRAGQYIHWLCTISYEKLNNKVDLALTLIKICDGYVFQLERGHAEEEIKKYLLENPYIEDLPISEQEEIKENLGYKHWQVYIQLKKRNPKDKGLTITALKKIFPNAHFEKCNNIDACIKYCQKDDTRIDGPFYGGCIREVNKKDMELRNFEPREGWQVDLEKFIKSEADKRTVVWLYDIVGKSAKSLFVKYMSTMNNGNLIDLTTCKSQDILTVYDPDVKTYLIDIPRTITEFTPFTAIELIKNGNVSDGKLKKIIERKKSDINHHVIIFANFLPDLNNVSLDRWQIWRVYNHTKYEILTDRNDVEFYKKYDTNDKYIHKKDFIKELDKLHDDVLPPKKEDIKIIKSSLKDKHISTNNLIIY